MSEEAANPTPSKKKSRAIWLVLALLIGGGGGGAAYYFLVMQPQQAEADTAEQGPAPALYLELRPAFVVNLSGQDSGRFLQAEVDLMARDQAALDAVNTHMPAVRNNLLLIFGSQRYAELQSRDGKEALQRQVLDEINAILGQREGDLQVEEVYFSSFVMQ